jgi:hypothetical protein
MSLKCLSLSYLWHKLSPCLHKNFWNPLYAMLKFAQTTSILFV